MTSIKRSKKILKLIKVMVKEKKKLEQESIDIKECK